MQPSVCIDAVFEGVDLEVALAEVARLGISAFEFWCWWEKDLDRLMQIRDQHSLKIAACCTRFESLVDPGSRTAYLDGLAQSIAAAKRLDCPTLISQVGDFRPDVPRQEQQECLVAGLREAAQLLAGSGIVLAIEPLNELVDHKGYYLVSSHEAFAIVDKVASPHVKVTFDIYHQQISEGNLIHNAMQHVDSIAHFHAAGNPGRHELSPSEIDYRSVIEAIANSGYQGYFGLEYWPQRPAAEGLAEAVTWFS